MPYIDVRIHPAPAPQQAAAIASAVTGAMVDIMGKRREVTAVRVTGGATDHWTIGGKPPKKHTAYVDVKITVGTNTAEEKSRLLQHVHESLVDTLGGLEEASYIVIHELSANDWGYAGISQAARKAKPA